MRFARCSYFFLRLPLFSFQRSMQSEPNFKLLTPLWSECQQQNLSKNLLWVADCLSNKLTLICQGVFKLASNAPCSARAWPLYVKSKSLSRPQINIFFESLFDRLNDGPGPLYKAFLKWELSSGEIIFCFVRLQKRTLPEGGRHQQIQPIPY
jgi:hypothetical protein